MNYTSNIFRSHTFPERINTTAITHIESIFPRYVTSKMKFSDNGTQYTLCQFDLFAKQWNFIHKPSNPKFPQCNGFEQRSIPTIKIH